MSARVRSLRTGDPFRDRDQSAMKYVYIVFSVIYARSLIVGVYGTRSSAEAAVKQHRKSSHERGHVYTNITIEEQEVL